MYGGGGSRTKSGNHLKIGFQDISRFGWTFPLKGIPCDRGSMLHL